MNINAFEHEHSPVQFLEYNSNIIEKNKHLNKPFYLLFSAQWCYWCKVFAKKTLMEERVYSYLNENFINIFIDADIHTTAYQKFKATGWPYTVFLNPNGTIHYKYAGTVFPDDFIEVLKEVRDNIADGRSIPGQEPDPYEYAPPDKLDKSRLKSFPQLFRQTVIENFDDEQSGVGKGEKAVFPQTFLYLLNTSSKTEKSEAIQAIHATLKNAIENIYDPIEGGFFRYAETRDWQVPHYEKMGDLNAGIVLLLNRIAKETNSPELKVVADKTLNYLGKTLYNSEAGSFLSFQEADEHYYFLNEEGRKSSKAPLVIQKVFTDRLARTLNYLLDILNDSEDEILEEKVRKSLNFLSKMVSDHNQIYHYYALSKKQWLSKSGLSDYALLAPMFLKAANRLGDRRYQDAASKVLQMAQDQYFDSKLGIFAENLTENWSDVEYHMEINGLLTQAMMLLPAKNGRKERMDAIAGQINYFSAMDEIFEDRSWDTKEWEFLESYVPYLKATERFLK
ncbi:MAG: thioredoxin domain-containing protein [SAR324 cluster bacterium]|nr:thioredoxin domain-containing protein [SAR324 cluster bacterium]